MKYYKLSKDGKDLNVVIACEDEDKERLAFEKFGKQYTLTECEAPKNATLVNEEPCIPGAGIYMHEYHMMGGFANERHVMFDAPKCAKCLNRYGRSERQRDWCTKHWREEKCYRFKLER